MAISWQDFKERQKQLEKEQKNSSNIDELAEMCDVCGWRNNIVYRTAFWHHKVKFVIRHCPHCNPFWKWAQIESDLPKVDF